MAKFFPYALPPTVSAETIAVIIRLITRALLSENDVNILIAIEAERPPDITPAISPITSLQKLETFSAFHISDIDSFEPGTRFADFA